MLFPADVIDLLYFASPNQNLVSNKNCLFLNQALTDIGLY